MSFGIIRQSKIKTATDVANRAKHDYRTSVRNNNKDIDPAKITQNDILIAPPDGNINKAIDRRIKNGYTGKRAIRKDAVRAIDVLITFSNDLKNPLANNDYLMDGFEWAKKHYGADNIVSAVIHRDERTPHLHIIVVPLTIDGRLSADSVLGGRREFQQFQDDFYNDVSKKYGFERGNRTTWSEDDMPRKHTTVTKFKQDTNYDKNAPDVPTVEPEPVQPLLAPASLPDYARAVTKQDYSAKDVVELKSHNQNMKLQGKPEKTMEEYKAYQAELLKQHSAQFGG